ncbi:transcriptional regulator [Bacillus sp. M6-12]|uniref:septation regulator SpoVG n=1 Tax=Bacillus sp. M6-12 TaxID=2054166 RepID=UPI000C78E510|nr:septation regulator SpoVG [Bacillus sp. M6-12]PLS19041.1 transcriptional regulator [Bacillus sp. M6-12]
MKITEVRITKAEGQGTLKAFASVTLDGVFAVHGIRVVEGKNGLFVSMPNRQVKEGEYKDIAHPVTKEFKQELSDAVLAEFNK